MILSGVVGHADLRFNDLTTQLALGASVPSLKKEGSFFVINPPIDGKPSHFQQD